MVWISLWGQGIGYQLMNHALTSLKKEKPSAKVVLWTMRENELSGKFYTRCGFIESGKSRISSRNEDSFEEIQFEILL